MANNRRRHARIRARGVAAHVRTGHGRIACQVENVSMGGMFVRTDQIEEVGTELFVDLVKPGWKKQLSIEARVSSRIDVAGGRMSHQLPGMGMQFVRLDDKQHQRLQSLLRELGAPEEDLQVTLPDEEAEVELRALDLNDAPPEPLEARTQPLWQQVQLVEEEERRPSLQADIEGVLREVDVAPPGPLELHPEPEQAPVLPDAGAPDAARLMVQLRGLVMQLSDAQQQLAQRELEIERLKEELQILRGAIDSARKN